MCVIYAVCIEPIKNRLDMEHSDTARQIIYVAFDNAMFLIVILTKTFCNKSCIPKDKNSAIII